MLGFLRGDISLRRKDFGSDAFKGSQHRGAVKWLQSCQQIARLHGLITPNMKRQAPTEKRMMCFMGFGRCFDDGRQKV